MIGSAQPRPPCAMDDLRAGEAVPRRRVGRTGSKRDAKNNIKTEFYLDELYLLSGLLYFSC